MASPIIDKKLYVVAMSGGVDSSVAAAMMVAQGHDVIGITLQLAPYRARGRAGSCCAGADLDDARFVAQQLGIPHYVLDFEARFKEHVLDDFTASYLEGKTPLPCVRCNQRIKFGDLMRFARALNAHGLVTGHYAQIKPDGLYRAKDKSRDQSYFLFATPRKDLDFLHFPLGGMLKSEIRARAHAFKLKTAAKPESQDLCFVHDGGYANVIRALSPNAGQKGDILHINGNLLGQHDGIEQFTIGQRRKLNLGGALNSSSQEPLYVVRIDADAHRIIVGPKKALAQRTIPLHAINWIDRPADEKIDISVQWRSQQEPLDAVLHLERADEGYVDLSQDAYGIAPGQACVFYRKQQVLGGGFIATSS